MWLWIKHWLDWVMNDLRPLARNRPHGQAIHIRYEKAGLSLYDLPVPWAADAVIVEVRAYLRPDARRKTDFSLRLPGGKPIPPESLRPEPDDRHRLTFRLPVPTASTSGELLWKNHLLSRVSIPVLTAADFLTGLSFALPTISARLGEQAVSAQTFVATQCKGLIASAVLRSPIPLSPVADLGLRVIFRNDRTQTEQDVRVPLSSSQLTAREAVITAVPPRQPRRIGSWTVIWQLGDRELGRQRVQGIPARRFEQSLRVSDTRFVVADKLGTVRVTRQLPQADFARLGPCFHIASSETGMAGVCTLQVHAVVPGEDRPPLLHEQEVLITDGPAAFAPGLVDAADLVRVTGFELRHKGKLLGSISLSPIPTASLNSEGGFKPAPEFSWSTTAEDELSDRLARLMNGGLP